MGRLPEIRENQTDKNMESELETGIQRKGVLRINISHIRN